MTDHPPPPVSCNSVKTLDTNFNQMKKPELKLQMGESLAYRVRYSLTLDEYTSVQNKRYLNINIHDEIVHWSLGLIEVNSKFGAEQCAAVVNSCLNKFGLNLDKAIVGCTTDGASMMVKFGRENLFEQQQCIAHAIHLAVVDTFYVTKRDRTIPQVMVENSEGTDDESLSEKLTNDLLQITSELETKISVDINIPYEEIINKLRRICCLFRRFTDKK